MSLSDPFVWVVVDVLGDCDGVVCVHVSLCVCMCVKRRSTDNTDF